MQAWPCSLKGTGPSGINAMGMCLLPNYFISQEMYVYTELCIGEM